VSQPDDLGGRALCTDSPTNTPCIDDPVPTESRLHRRERRQITCWWILGPEWPRVGAKRGSSGA
jgi:hypothetical protein